MLGFHCVCGDESVQPARQLLACVQRSPAQARQRIPLSAQAEHRLSGDHFVGRRLSFRVQRTLDQLSENVDWMSRVHRTSRSTVQFRIQDLTDGSRGEAAK